MKIFLRTLPFSVLVIAGIFISLSMVHAQDETTVSVLPAESTIVINGSNIGEVEIYVTNGVNVNAFDITLTYNPALLVLEEVIWGDYLSNLRKMIEVNDSGFYRLSVTQWGQPGVYGDGTLLHLSFSGVAPGVSAITITNVQLSTPQGSGSFPPVNNGSITTAYDPGPLDKSPVSADVSLQGRPWRGGVPMTLALGEVYGLGPYTAFSMHEPGVNLDFGDVVNDTYALITDQPGYLNLAEDINVSGALNLPPLCLLAGDADGDNAINTSDLDAIRDAFGVMGEGISADVNFDGVVDLRDLALAGGNFGLTPSEAYGGWLP